MNLWRYVSLLLVPRWVRRRYMRGKWTTSVPMLRAYGNGNGFMIVQVERKFNGLGQLGKG